MTYLKNGYLKLDENLTQMQRVEAVEASIAALEASLEKARKQLHQEEEVFAPNKPGQVIECRSTVFGKYVWRPGYILSAHVYIRDSAVVSIHYSVILKMKDGRWDNVSDSFDSRDVRVMDPNEAMRLAAEYKDPNKPRKP